MPPEAIHDYQLSSTLINSHSRLTGALATSFEEQVSPSNHLILVHKKKW